MAGRDGSRAPKSVWFGPDLLLHDLDLGLVHSGASARTLSAHVKSNSVAALLGRNDALAVAVAHAHGCLGVGHIEAEGEAVKRGAAGEAEQAEDGRRDVFRGGRHCLWQRPSPNRPRWTQ